jgi:hypothetical protein
MKPGRKPLNKTGWTRASDDTLYARTLTPEDRRWREYFNTLLNAKDRRKHLSFDDLLSLLRKQGGKCALTGVKLTNIHHNDRLNGVVWTNASIDRITAGGSYELANIQLVCRAINMWRGHLPLDMFIHWCHLVASNTVDMLATELEEKYHEQLAEKKPHD